ncbi:uncharacterized protein LAJ45_02269 [Morchella importuna]|uniref:uncharacterized protein n=1 Tax=Morchella importuna TaxID=1174673 RepID=UPI001E8D011E|nr:uncharacterized protein LAJ45_02269 [Morchella importuna]KAH8153456.1 hypothetical protein LAJ45_02269 [Morchella importuna]
MPVDEVVLSVSEFTRCAVLQRRGIVFFLVSEALLTLEVEFLTLLGKFHLEILSSAVGPSSSSTRTILFHLRPSTIL